MRIVEWVCVCGMCKIYTLHYITMVRGSILFIFLLLWKQGAVTSVRLIELRVPTHAIVGQEALLGCQFDMEDDVLYSVKWYKDGREFYRYVPRNKKPAIFFYTPGVTVDMSRSSSDHVTLTRLTSQSAGVYRCEVSGEAPGFATVSDAKFINMQVLPKVGPIITGLQKRYDYGDRVSVNCTSFGSRPEAQLRWLVNGKPVPKTHIRGQWFRATSDPPDTMDVILQMTFVVAPLHFRNGVMEIKCQSTIAPLYHQEAIHIIPDPDAVTPEPPDITDDEDYAKPTPGDDEPSFIYPGPGVDSSHTQVEVPPQATQNQNKGFSTSQSLPVILSSLLLQITVWLLVQNNK